MSAPWVFPDLSKEDADAMLLAPPVADGKFLVRKRVGKDDDYVLSLVFKKRATHHLVSKALHGDYFHVNKQSYGQFTTIEEVIKALGADTPPAGWPLRLGEHIKPKSAQNDDDDDDDEALPPKPAVTAAISHTPGQQPQPELQGLVAVKPPTAPPPAAAPVPQEESLPAVPMTAPAPTAAAAPAQAPKWLHNEMTKVQADELASAGTSREGKFFVRPRGAQTPNNWVLTVIYKGKPTHHLIKQTAPDRPLIVNNQPAGNSFSVQEVVEYHRVARPKWPVPLSVEVPRQEKYIGSLDNILKKSSLPAPPAAVPSAAADLDQQAAAQAAHQRAQEEAARAVEREASQKAEAEQKEAARRTEEHTRQQEEQAHAERERADTARRADEEKAKREREAEERRREPVNPSRVEETAVDEQLRSPVPAPAPVVSAPPEVSRAAAAPDAVPRIQRNTNILAERKWEDGNHFDVTVQRENITHSFGFGVASFWMIEGRVPVISWVDSDGPAFGILEIEDEIVGLNGESVQDVDIDEVKNAIRRMGTEFRARIFRRRNKIAHDPPKKTRPSKAKCSGGVWCQCEKCLQRSVKESEKAMKQMLKQVHLGKDRVTVILSHRAGEEDLYVV